MTAAVSSIGVTGMTTTAYYLNTPGNGAKAVAVTVGGAGWSGGRVACSATTWTGKAAQGARRGFDEGRVRVGSVNWRGWSFADNALMVLDAAAIPPATTPADREALDAAVCRRQRF